MRDSGVNNFTTVCAALTLSLELVSSILGLAIGNKKFYKDKGYA